MNADIVQRIARRRVLVTGAEGFIGSHLTEALAAAGAKVRALVLYNSFNSWGWLEGTPHKDAIEIVAGDIRDAAFVQDLTQDCDIVLHLAALIAIPFSYRAPGSFVDTNVGGTLNILDAARRHGVSRVVCTSTSEVYGTAQYVPIDELHPLNAQSPYAASKIGADQMALAYHRSFGVPVVVLRPFNTFGPRQSARAVIPTIISQVASGMRRIKLGALHPTRDFSYVDDTVSGFIHAAIAENGVGEVINVGSGFEISIGDTAVLIGEVMGADIEVVHADERTRPAASEVERLFASAERAAGMLGWTPQYGGHEGFRRGLEKTAAWFQNPANLARYKPDEYNV